MILVLNLWNFMRLKSLLPIAMIACFGIAYLSASKFDKISINKAITYEENRENILLFDVDGTLYQDSSEIEAYIANNIRSFVLNYSNLNSETSDRLYKTYGSTFQGMLVEKLYNTNNSVHDFYQAYATNSFNNVPMLGLLHDSSSNSHSSSSTGYSNWIRSPSNILRRVPGKLLLASNSPKHHIRRVLNRLSIPESLFERIYTPDDDSYDHLNRNDSTKYHMKSSKMYWNKVLNDYPIEKYRLTLIDDNRNNINFVKTIGINGIKIDPKVSGLEDAILKYLNIYPDDAYSNVDKNIRLHTKEISNANNINETNFNNEGFIFDEIKYLKAKNMVDNRSYNEEIENMFIDKLYVRIKDKIETILGQNEKIQNEGIVIPLTVVDVGAGLLNMIDHMIFIINQAIKKIFSPSKDYSINHNNNISLNSIQNSIHISVVYIAFESNLNVWQASNKNLEQLNYSRCIIPTISQIVESTFHGNNTNVYQRTNRIESSTININMTVVSCNQNFLRKESVDYIHQIIHLLLYDPISSRNINHNLTVVDRESKSNTNASCDYDSNYSPSSHSKDHKSWKDTIVDVVIGCCVADLIPPQSFVSWIMHVSNDKGSLIYLPITFCGNSRFHLAKKINKSMTTMESLEVLDSREYSDLTSHLIGKHGHLSQYDIFTLYHHSLIELGHSIDPMDLFSQFQASNCNILSSYYGNKLNSNLDNDWNQYRSRSSNVNNLKELRDYGYYSSWVVSSLKDTYLFQCLLQFLCHGVIFGTNIEKNVSTVVLWFQKLFEHMKMLSASLSSSSYELLFIAQNIDILIECPGYKSNINHLSSSAPRILNDDNITTTSAFNDDDDILSIEFIGPKQVRVIKEYYSLSSLITSLQSNQILIKAEHSLISSGTELKIYRGDFDTTQPMDTTFDTMKDSTMSYPMKYGYCHVGKVIAVGKNSSHDTIQLIGKRVFSFTTHTNYVVSSLNDVIIVPDGISSLDAIFLPTIETAVSLVMSANPMLGEKIGIIGQGLIGLITAIVLKEHVSLTLTSEDLHLYDINEKRLDIASEYVGSSHRHNPILDIIDNNNNSNSSNNSSNNNKKRNIPIPSDLDVVIEVSGHPSGLQTAIDSTRQDGKIIIGSWYGEKPIPLHLGLKFHRHGITTISSQVSSIPAHLSSRWTKSRRFNLCWKLIQKLKPSKLFDIIDRHHHASFINSKTRIPMKTEQVCLSYDQLDKGTIALVAIEYD